MQPFAPSRHDTATNRECPGGLLTGASAGETAQHPEVAQRLKSQLETWAAELDPPGLATKAMSPVWEQYFDFYLDGKPVKPPVREPPRIQGWIARNSRMVQADGALHIVPARGTPGAPFLACANLDLAGPATARVVLQPKTGGEVGVSWRLEGQSDFVPGQTASATCSASESWQTLELEIPATRKIIHIRVQLPQGESRVRHIRLEGARGSGRQWRFDETSGARTEAPPPGN